MFSQSLQQLDSRAKTMAKLHKNAPVSTNNSLFSFFANSPASKRISDVLDESLGVGVGFEPTPFKDGAQLQPLPDDQNVYVPTSSARMQPTQGHRNLQWLRSLQDSPLTISSSMEDDCDDCILLTHAANSIMDSDSQKHQEDRWEEHYQKLLRYKKKFGNCRVPQNYPEDLALARWCRRQRHQYKRKQSNQGSALSDKRQRLLEDVGFVWDPQTDVWEIRRQDLEEYKRIHGHCNVPSRYAENPQLATWVKRQRRQYKEMKAGMLARLPRERFEILNRMGFVWKIRGDSQGGGKSLGSM